MNTKNIVIGVIVIVIIIIAGMYFAGSREIAPVEETVMAGEYDTFAQCLTESNLLMYGSVTCGVCKKQRKAFGNSFQFINEIECVPSNENAQTELCITKNISHTPTWILEDEDGNDVVRFDAGFQKLEELSEASGCPLVKDELPDDESNI